MLSPTPSRKFISSIAIAMALSSSPALSPVVAQQSAAGAQPARKSSLPDEALQQAREAEQHLAANLPDNAIAILRELDKKYPANAAISLRLAQIYDTLNRNGHALFYYRRYIQLAGQRALGMAVERVSSLELMVGIDADAEAAAREVGESTRPIATPAPQIRRTLATEAKDGSMIPLNNEEDILNIQQQGIPQSAPAVLVPTSSAIIIPPELSAVRSPAPRQYAEPSVQPPAETRLPSSTRTQTRTPEGAPPDSGSDQLQLATEPPVIAPTKSARAQAPVYSGATPRPPDVDALLANAFRKADSTSQIPKDMEEKIAEREKYVSDNLSKNTTPQPTKSPASVPQPRTTPPSAQQGPSADAISPKLPAQQPTIAYIRQTPEYASKRIAEFFNISQGSSPQATVIVINDLKSAVVTFSIIPENHAAAVSAILMPGESKTIQVNPATYDINANASTSDYSPITLMNTEFKYTFHGNRQYTRRFSETSLQQVD